RRIGVLMNLTADDPDSPVRLAAFLQGLQQLGWTVGQNVQIDYRWGAGSADLMRKYAAELVTLAPDVILAHSSAPLRPCCRKPALFPLFSRSSPTRLAPAMSIAWRAPAATRPALPTLNIRSPGNGWNCSKTSRPL